MNRNELQRSLRQLRLGGMAAVLETRLQQAQAEPMAPIDLLATLVSDELTRRSDRLLERRRKVAAFRDPNKTLDNFDFSFNPKMNRSMVFDLATGVFIDRREDALFLGPGGTGKSHLAQAIGQAAILQGWCASSMMITSQRLADNSRKAPSRRLMKSTDAITRGSTHQGLVPASSERRASATPSLSKIRKSKPNFVASSVCHCSVMEAGLTIRMRAARRRAFSSRRIRPASMVLPRPTSSAISSRGRGSSKARNAGTCWYGSKSIFERDDETRRSSPGARLSRIASISS